MSQCQINRVPESSFPYDIIVSMRQTKAHIIQVLQELKPLILSKGITSVALFGSFAKDKATPYSDVDIAIRKSPDFLQKKGSYAYFDLIDEIKVLLRQKLHRNIDIFDLDSDSPFKEMVEREMIRV